MSTLERIQTQVVAELEGWRDDFLPALTEREGAESASAIFDEARAQLLHITSSVPDPGWTAPCVAGGEPGSTPTGVCARAMPAAGPGRMGDVPPTPY